ncbi:MAG: hypothetical protein ACOX6Q_01275, partial [Candidatus Dojkabacteria bacterium]
YFIIEFYSDYGFPLKFLITLAFNLFVTVIIAMISIIFYDLLSKLLGKMNFSFLVPCKKQESR